MYKLVLFKVLELKTRAQLSADTRELFIAVGTKTTEQAAWLQLGK